ncbi:Protein of unknown function [Aliiroseovarius halocynthiae]|uniref:DUF1403 family protein n=1 Tax=Aliiroseovarius halocynthiae TaxID=985055 RepID=A0A545SKV2_9RHOB|nr:DUF1403 family protein [Aliiroseovarius halocynthiae]TQV65610.1 DUF1403 family protein [Aliiroseovarius halocynthiae]SMR84093.1 Protein of unknown function [Aliiroseovarius halocynthiae]
MTDGLILCAYDSKTPAQLPRWITGARAETLDDMAFLSGAALSYLHIALHHPQTPGALVRARLALRAAEVSMQITGRPERAGELRDEVLLLRPGDLPGPAGAVAQSWQRAVARPLSVKSLARAVPKLTPVQVVTWMDAGQGGAIPRAAQVLEAVLTDAPQADSTALIFADAALARAIGLDHLLPCLSVALTRADLRKRGAELHMACHHAILRAAKDILPLMQDLSRRAAHVSAVSPKLRAKQAEAALECFLTQDAVAPMSLPMPDRAARRLCDRLVALGAVRELTGRDTFRLYGIAP